MEAKGLRVNAGKIKVMQCFVSRFQSEDSGKYPCGVLYKLTSHYDIFRITHDINPTPTRDMNNVYSDEDMFIGEKLLGDDFYLKCYLILYE